MLALYLSMLDSDTNREKFLHLYNAHSKRVYAVALSILKNEMQAEDAVQQTWLKVIEFFERISRLPADEVESYIVVMVRHQALQQREHELREVSVKEPWDAEVAVSDESIDNGMELREMIRSMPERYRQVLELRLVMELSAAETAEALDLSITTVTTRLQRGREMLQSKLRKEGYVL